MNEALALQSIAKSTAAAKRAVKSLDIQQIERALANLSAAAETIKERESIRAQRKKEVAVKKLKSMMDELGISAADITGSSKPKTKGNTTGPKKAIWRPHIMTKRTTRTVRSHPCRFGPTLKMVVRSDCLI